MGSQSGVRVLTAVVLLLQKVHGLKEFARAVFCNDPHVTNSNVLEILEDTFITVWGRVQNVYSNITPGVHCIMFD